MEVITTKTKNQLAQVEKLNDEVKGHAQAMVLAAIEMGRLLTEIKADCKRGEFMKLVEQHTTVGQRQANKYMRAYEHRDQLPSGTEDQLLSLTAFMDLIADKRPKPSPSSETIGNWIQGLVDKFNESDDAVQQHSLAALETIKRSVGLWEQAYEEGHNPKDFPVNDPCIHAMVDYVYNAAVPSIQSDEANIWDQDCDDPHLFLARLAFHSGVAHCSGHLWMRLLMEGDLAHGEFTMTGGNFKGLTREQFVEAGKALSIGEWAMKFDSMAEAHHWMPHGFTIMADEFYERGLLSDITEEEA